MPQKKIAKAKTLVFVEDGQSRKSSKAGKNKEINIRDGLSFRVRRRVGTSR
jgi:hypothetical protein